MEMTEGNSKMISNMIRLVFEREITWETLESILDDMSSTLAKSKQVIKLLIDELKAFDSKSPNEVIRSDIVETESNPMKSKDGQIIADPAKSGIEDFEDCVNDSDEVKSIHENNSEEDTTEIIEEKKTSAESMEMKILEMMLQQVVLCRN